MIMTPREIYEEERSLVLSDETFRLFQDLMIQKAGVVLDDRLDRDVALQARRTVEPHCVALARPELGSGLLVEEDLTCARSVEVRPGSRDERRQVRALVPVHSHEIEVRLGDAVPQIDRLRHGDDHWGQASHAGIGPHRCREVRVDGVREVLESGGCGLVVDPLVGVAVRLQDEVHVHRRDGVVDHEAPGDDGRADQEAENQQDRPTSGASDVPHPDAEREAVPRREDERRQDDDAQQEEEERCGRAEHGIPLRNELSVAHSQRAIADRGDLGVVGDDDDRLLVFPVQVAQEAGHLVRALLIEVAGRFVGPDDGGAADERSREGDPLLLAPGELGGFVLDPVAEIEVLEDLGRALARLRAVHPRDQ